MAIQIIPIIEAVTPLIAARINPLWSVVVQIGVIALICGVPLLGYGAYKGQIPTALGGWVVAVVTGTFFGLIVGCVIALGFMILISAIRPKHNGELRGRDHAKPKSKTGDIDY